MDLPAAVIYRLDVLASHLSLERGRPVGRSELVAELLTPHLRSVVVSVRGPVPREDEAAG